MRHGCTPDLIREWLAPGSNVVVDVSCDAVVGGGFLIRSKAPDGVLHTIRGTYRELVPTRRIAMTWAYSGPIELLCEMETLIEIDLREVGSESTSMTLTQSHFTTEEAANGYRRVGQAASISLAFCLEHQPGRGITKTDSGGSFAMTDNRLARHVTRAPWIVAWFSLDAIVALAPPLYWAVDGKTTPVIGLPAAVFYFVAVGVCISASIVAAYLAEARTGETG